MSRIRSIKPEWRTDQKLGKAGLAARVLSVALITLADDEGRGEFRAPVLAMDVFGYEDEPSRIFREALAKLSGWFVRVYEVRGEEYFEIVNWKRHQKVDHARASRIPPPPDEPQPPENTPEPEQSRESRETFARDSRDARESLAPDLDRGSGIRDHGSWTADRARAREAPTRSEPRPPNDRPPLERARSTLSAGYGRRYERETSDPWQGMGANGQAIRDVAAWCVASNPGKPEAAAKLVLAGMFADGWMREKRWPWGPVAKDPAKYAALGRETLGRERRAAKARREAERRAAEEREREAQTERDAVPPPEDARALIRSLTRILSMPREDASQRTEERRRELEAQARELREAAK